MSRRELAFAPDLLQMLAAARDAGREVMLVERPMPEAVTEHPGDHVAGTAGRVAVTALTLARDGAGDARAVRAGRLVRA